VSHEIEPGVVVSAHDHALEPLEHDPADVVSGQPATAAQALVDYGGVEVGLWEMTEGVMTDVEADEVFVVLSGRATVVVAADGSAPERRLDIRSGDVVRLAAGMRTTWTVHETLRKLYVAPGS
jgi:uncharacterized cupin superfamily protein